MIRSRRRKSLYLWHAPPLPPRNLETSMQRISYLKPEYVVDRLAAVEDARRKWIVAAVMIVALLFGLSVK